MCVCVPVRVVFVGFFCEGESSSDVKGSRESGPHSHHLIVSVSQQVMSCCPCCSIIALVFLSYVSFLSSARHVPQRFSGSLPPCLVIFQPQATTKPIYILMLWVLCPISSACLCVSPHAYGRLFCVVHWLLFCHYMLQIGGFVFYEDVFTGDWQVKHCNSLLAQRNMQDPLSCPQLPPLTFAPSPTSALMPL